MRSARTSRPKRNWPDRARAIRRRLFVITAVAALGLAAPSERAIAKGNVWAWGDNTFSQTSSTVGGTPTKVSGLFGVSALAAGAFHSLALKSDGTVWAWGRNQNGQLGNGTISMSPPLSNPTPAQVAGLAGVIAVASKGDQSLALKNDGTVWAWGANSNGQLGDGTNVDSATPVQVVGLSDVIAIAAGQYHGLALKRDGTVWAWGDGNYAQLGNGSFFIAGSTAPVLAYTPVQVVTGTLTPVGPIVGPALTGVVAIGAGGFHSLAVAADGTVWDWGYNGLGQLGDGLFENDVLNGGGAFLHGVATPSLLGGISSIDAGDYYTAALQNDGTVSTTGYDCEGELGNPTSAASDCTAFTYGVATPIQVADLNGTADLSGVSAVAAGGAHALALNRDGTVVAWGFDYYGQLGNGTCPTPVGYYGCSTPIAVTGLAHASAIAAGGDHSLALVPPVQSCSAGGTLTVSPGVKSTPSTKAGRLSFKGTLTGCFGWFAGNRFPISAGSFTLSIKNLNPGATCGSLNTGPGVRYSAKLSFKFQGINPKTGKLAIATASTSVGLASVSEQTSPFGHTATSLSVTNLKNPLLGHSATLTLVYDETPAQVSASCAGRAGLKSLHFGSVLDRKIQWNPVNGPSTFDLGD